MSDAILCPQVGQDLTEAKVVAIHVKLGDAVKRGDIVAEVESEKASFEVEAFSNGIVVELPYKVGETAVVLEPLVVLGKEDDAPGSVALAKPQRSSREVVELAAAQERAPAKASTNGSGRSSPLARRLAQKNGINIAGLAGSGPHGAVVQRDVESALAKGGAAARADAADVVPVLNVKTLRDGSGDPVFFIHGFGADLSSWRPLAMQMRIGNPLLALDLPGHGASPEVEGGFDAYAEALAAVMRGRGPVHLVGHSLGAALAVRAASLTGVKVKSLTLMSPAGLGVSIDGSFISGYLAARSEAALSAQMRRLVHDGANLPAAMIRATLAARESSAVVERQARAAAVLFEGHTQLFSVRSELTRFDGPCRILLGRRDTIIPIAETEAALPDHVAVHHIANAGHLPFAEALALSVRLIGETVRSAG